MQFGCADVDEAWHNEQKLQTYLLNIGIAYHKICHPCVESSEAHPLSVEFYFEMLLHLSRDIVVFFCVFLNGRLIIVIHKCDVSSVVVYLIMNVFILTQTTLPSCTWN